MFQVITIIAVNNKPDRQARRYPNTCPKEMWHTKVLTLSRYRLILGVLLNNTAGMPNIQFEMSDTVN
jgi:hypothetical protein